MLLAVEIHGCSVDWINSSTRWRMRPCSQILILLQVLARRNRWTRPLKGPTYLSLRTVPIRMKSIWTKARPYHVLNVNRSYTVIREVTVGSRLPRRFSCVSERRWITLHPPSMCLTTSTRRRRITLTKRMYRLCSRHHLSLAYYLPWKVIDRLIYNWRIPTVAMHNISDWNRILSCTAQHYPMLRSVTFRK